MNAPVIVSYDGTANDDDALILGRALCPGPGELTLAYVRHSRELDPRREELALHDAERRLRSGIDLVGDPELNTRVLFSGSTADGLQTLARTQSAQLIVFGSDYRTAPGRAEPGNTAQRLLDGGRFSVAIACAGLRLSAERPLGTVAAASPDDDPAVQETVHALCATHDLIDASPGVLSADLIVVGSAPGTTPGRVVLTGQARNTLNSARGSVLVLARDRPLHLTS